jgi:hypothetical protein
MDRRGHPRPTTTRRRPIAALVGVLTVLALIAGACTQDASTVRTSGPERSGTAVSLPEGLELVGALTSFDACDDLLAYVKERALEDVSPWGLEGGGSRGWFADGEETADDAGDAVAAEAGTDGAAPVAGEDFSGTNVQEVGVDEPDVVKTDGHTMYVVSGGVLEVLDVTGDEPRSLATLRLGESWDAQLMLHEDRLLVTSGSPVLIPFADETTSGSAATDDDVDQGGEVASDDGDFEGEVGYDDGMMPGDWGGTTLTSIDVSDPAAPVVDERLTLDGWIVNSRMVDGVVRVVVRTEAGVNVPWEYPRTGSLRAERAALDANRALIESSTAEDWLPYYVHERADGTGDEGILLACNRVAHPDEYAGLGILSVLTVDLATGALVPGAEATGILAAGDTVYASVDHLYVATTRWMPWDSEEQFDTATTELHAFDISDPRTTEYRGSGAVPGTLLSQWAMSEHDGHLRVASTVGDAWDERTPSESVVTVLEVGDGALAQVGQVTGLGLTETIHAVRFMGEVGYVVTFRQTDPLYTLDLRDPTDPRVTGELKILGYSAYLHPMGDDLLLGVGQDADERGRTKGMQLSLFDVSDPAAPAVLDQIDLADSYSDVEYDHRAFLHWPATGLTVVPFERWVDWSVPEPQQQDPGPASGVLAFTADPDDGLTEQGRLSHVVPYLRDLGIEDVFEPRDGEDPYEREDRLWQYQYETKITRSVVIGDRLVTLSHVGVAVHDLDTLAERGWLTFGSGRR